jgi:hypothetical protein
MIQYFWKGKGSKGGLQRITCGFLNFGSFENFENFGSVSLGLALAFFEKEGI